MCQWLSKTELKKKLFFFPVKIHAFRVKKFDMLKNEILKTQIKKNKILMCKKLRITKNMWIKKCKLLKFTQLNQLSISWEI